MLTLKYCCQQPAPMIAVLLLIFAVVAIEITIFRGAEALIETIRAPDGIPVAIGCIPTTYPVTDDMVSVVLGELLAPDVVFETVQLVVKAGIA